MKLLGSTLLFCGLCVMYSQYSYQRDMKKIREMHDQAYKHRMGKY